jgi:CheY-like chemotaxis protein
VHPPQPNVLLIGGLPECEPPANQPAAGALSPASIACTKHVADLPAARQHLESPRQTGNQSRQDYDVVVLCEPRPGIWTDHEVAELRSLAPLARLVRLSGSLCEGQARSGRPAAGTWHVPWHRWPAFAARELSAATADAPWWSRPCWSLPLTATPDERALATFQPPAPRASGHVVICSPSAATAAALAATCHSAGYTTSRNPPCGLTTALLCNHTTAPLCSLTTALLWDTTVESLSDLARVASLLAAHPDVPLLAVAGFPRAEDIAAARAAGITAVLAKPLDTNELLWRLEQLSAKSNS